MKMRSKLRRAGLGSYGLHRVSERIAQRENCLTGMDVRVKLLMGVLTISLVMLSKIYVFPLLVFVLANITMGSVGVRYKDVKRRLLAPFSVVFFLILVQPFMTDGRVLFKISFFDLFVLKASLEGMLRGLLIGGKVLSSVSVLLCIIYTTTLHKVIMAASSLNVPSTLIDLSLLMYRYIFLFIDESIKVFQAQKLRFGYATFKNGLRSSAVLSGLVFVRAFDQASLIEQAMRLRLYRGSFTPLKLEPMSFYDTLLPGFIACLLILIFLGQSCW